MVRSFNTQPPEGGWFEWGKDSSFIACFNTRPKAGGLSWGFSVLWKYRFNTQPPEGGWGWVG